MKASRAAFLAREAKEAGLNAHRYITTIITAYIEDIVSCIWKHTRLCAHCVYPRCPF